MDPSEIKKCLHVAEESVAEVQDAQLREKAFAIVLEHLLQQHKTKKKLPQSIARPRQQTKNVQSQVGHASIVLTEDQLEHLQEFLIKFRPVGREQGVFLLAIFLEMFGLKTVFWLADIESLYHQAAILPLKRKFPKMTPKQLKDALTWLKSPSRRKLWLVVDESGNYQITPAGRLAFSALTAKVELLK